MRDESRATVVCVHGAGGGGWEWSVWARVFAAAGFDVIAPDLQAASGGLRDTRYADYRAQVARWCEGAGSGAVLLGASLGGLLALDAAHSANAAALILVNPLPPTGIPGAAPHPPVVPWGRERALSATRRAMADADDAACLYALRRWRDESGAVLDEAMRGVAFEKPDCPVLVLAAELDEDVPASISGALAAALSADFVMLRRAGHVGPLLGRTAAATAEHVAAWLLERLPGRNARARA